MTTIRAILCRENSINMLLCWFFLLFLLFGPSEVAASTSLIVDVDLDSGNGPDTLIATVGDTLDAHFWIDCPDSLFAFGLTAGDTTGSLRWVIDSTGAPYSTPLGWTNISISEDVDGWITIQSTDFTTSDPLGGMALVASIRFVVAETSGNVTLGIDSVNSGYLGIDLTEGSFDSIERPTFALPQGASASGPGGSTPPSEDSPTTGDQWAWPSALLDTLLLGEGHYIYLAGTRVTTGRLVCSWQEGEPLYVNGIQVMPPSAILPTIPTSEVDSRYGQVPLITSLRKEGQSAQAAYAAWKNRRNSIITAFFGLFRRTVGGGGSVDDAKAAVSQMLLQEPEMIETSIAPEWGKYGLKFQWVGLAKRNFYSMSSIDGSRPLRSKLGAMPDYSQSQALVNALRGGVLSNECALAAISTKGGFTILASDCDSSSTSVGKAIQQIDGSTESLVLPGVLSAETVREIVRKRGER